MTAASETSSLASLGDTEAMEATGKRKRRGKKKRRKVRYSALVHIQ